MKTHADKLCKSVLVLILAASMAGQLRGGDPDRRIVTVDAGKEIGTIHSLQGMNLGPGPVQPGAVDVTAQFHDLRIDFIRTHYFDGPTQIDDDRPDRQKLVIFPDLNADPDKEESYHFGPSDAALKPIVDSGAQIMYCLGRSQDAYTTPPPDFDIYAKICRHIVMHYNAGWANGFRYGIKYWEFWSSPNFQRWHGTMPQFCQLYAKVAATLKAYDPELHVGGSACYFANHSGMQPLIEYCSTNHVPLDFISWQAYQMETCDPHELATDVERARKLLMDRGLKNTECIASEWNLAMNETDIGVGQRSALAAAFTATALIYLQQAGLDRSCYNRGDPGHDWSILSADGKYWKKAYAFKATGMMLDTPRELEVQGADTVGFAALAGLSADHSTVQILISNYEMFWPLPAPAGKPGRWKQGSTMGPLRRPYTHNQGYHLTVTNLPWGESPFTWKKYRLNEKDDFTVSEAVVGQGNQVTLDSDLTPPGFELVVITKK